jgi:hypothetical protein
MATPIGYQKIQTSNGILDIPVYAPGDVTYPVFRIRTPNGTGCYDLVSPTIETPLRVYTSSGLKGVNQGTSSGGAEPESSIDTNNFSTFGVTTVVEENTDEYIQAHTDSNGNGVVFPFAASVGDNLTCTVNVDILQGVDDVIAVRLWNTTQSKYITTNMVTGTQTSGSHTLSKSFTLTSTHLVNGDQIELRVVQSWKNSTHDDFIFRVMKNSTLRRE